MPLNHSRVIGIIRFESQVGSADASENTCRTSDVWRRLVEGSPLTTLRRAGRREEYSGLLAQRRPLSVPANNHRRRASAETSATISVVRADLGSLCRDLDDEYRGILVRLAAGDFSGA